MARSIWKGSISFGLVNVPVQIFSAIQDKSVHFHIMTKDGTCRLRQKLYCPETNKEYDFSETAKGYELSPDNYVILDKEEINALKPESGSVIDIKDFIDLAEVDPIYYEKPYYLGPAKGGETTYQLLLKAMQETQKVALAQFVMRQKGYLAVIRPMDDVLCLETMHYAEEVVATENIPGLDVQQRIGEKEKKIAMQLIEAMSGPFEPEKYKDEYTKQVQHLVKQKSKGKKIELPEAPKKSAKVIDLMDALKKSLDGKGKKSAGSGTVSRKKSKATKKATQSTERKKTARRRA